LCGDTHDRNGIEYASAATLGVTDAMAKAYERWVTYLDENAVMDFATIQQRFLERQHTVTPELRHVFVDEFQDTNPIQFAIHVGWLPNGETRLTVVGDDDQSVYRFRGSDIACFQGLEAECAKRGLGFRLERLEHNHRSTATIVAFSEAYRGSSVLNTVSMAKNIQPAPDADAGEPVRLLVGPWPALCDVVAAELAAEQRAAGAGLTPDAAVLLFSTSENNTRNNTAPGFAMRTALENRRLRVFNARNKTAGRPDSPVHDLLGLISYLIDPVRVAAVPGSRRPVEVHATSQQQTRRGYAEAAVPQFGSIAHAGFQKRFRKGGGGRLDQPAPDRADLIAYVDELRTRLVQAATAAPDRRRLTLSAFVARLMSFRYFRQTGYTPQLSGRHCSQPCWKRTSPRPGAPCAASTSRCGPASPPTPRSSGRSSTGICCG
jgi:DNA helicase-2/ATP-dependent DNA helicase PcrA